jgi:hypothetical protein
LIPTSTKRQDQERNGNGKANRDVDAYQVNLSDPEHSSKDQRSQSGQARDCISK